MAVDISRTAEMRKLYASCQIHMINFEVEILLVTNWRTLIKDNGAKYMVLEDDLTLGDRYC